MADDISLMEGFSAGGPGDWSAALPEPVRADLARLVSHSEDGIPIAPLYTRADQPASADFAGFPGFSPHWRGVRADDRRCRNLVRIADPDPAAAGQAVLAACAGGADGLVLVLDDGRPEDEGAEGIVLPLTDSEAAGAALAELLSDIRLDETPLVLEAGLRAGAGAEALLALFARYGGKPAAGSTLGLDPLAWAARIGADGAQSLKEALSWAGPRLGTLENAPAFFRLSGRIWHDAGASEAQELAIVAAGLVELLRRGEGAGIAPERLAASTRLHLMVDADFLFSIAKLRAMRAISSRIFDAAAVAAAIPPVSAETAPRMFTRHDPWTNILRAALAAQAALVAGADGVVVRAYTDALGFADAHAARVARNTLLIMRAESALSQIMDAAGGSYALEALTDKLIAHAWRLFQRIEAEGGLAAAVASGLVIGEIAAMAEKRAEAIATRRRPITGVSEYPNLDETLPTPPAQPDRAALRAAAGLTNPAQGASWRLRPRRLAQDFEAYRALCDRVLEEQGARPCVFLANIGPIARHTARASFAANAFAAGGIAAIANDGFTDAVNMQAAFKKSGARLAVVCGDDAGYGDEAAAFAKALKEAGARIVWLAGRPDEDAAAQLRRAGVDRFLMRNSNMLVEYDAALRALGIEPRARDGLGASA